MIPGRCTDLVGKVYTLCRVKLFRNSRVLGHGRLNGHVASIVSMFSKGMFGKRKCIWEVLERGTLYLEGTDDGKPKVVLQEVLQRKIFFP